MNDRIVERIEARAEDLVYREHANRYQFAEAHLQAGWTLDVACGVGYGAQLLRQRSEVSVVGVDIHQPALFQARRDYAGPRISFLAANGNFLPFRDGSLQNVVTLETIEHIADDHGFLRELIRVLAPEGICVLSTPNRAYSLRHGVSNPYHLREYSIEELRAVLERYFAVVSLFYQGFTTRYHDQVRSYSQSLKSHKAHLMLPVRLAIDYLYRPAKQMLPTAITNYFIRRLLGLAYPRPDPTDLIISPEPLEETSVFIAVCAQPRHE